MDLVVYDDDEKRYVPWAVALAAALLVALLTAALTFVLARQASGDDGAQAVGGLGDPAPASAPSATPTASPAAGGSSIAGPTPAPGCEAALLRADAVRDRGAAVDEALGRHTDIMNELLAERISADEALDRALPVLTDGATARERLEEAVTAYERARKDCAG